ncbi:hypothetical protein BYT27DRAFT_7195606 [Phlegmacium glaucopus]|nr:hypothetical protein BYT27DRAFT_7195606 [Phlegmacium glaucopus]
MEATSCEAALKKLGYVTHVTIFCLKLFVKIITNFKLYLSEMLDLLYKAKTLAFLDYFSKPFSMEPILAYSPCIYKES